MAKGVEQTIAVARDLDGFEACLGRRLRNEDTDVQSHSQKNEKNKSLTCQDKIKENSSKAWGLISRISALPRGNPDGVSVANYFVLQLHDMNESRTQPL